MAVFASYYILLPFVMNCGGQDLPYVVESGNSQDAEAQGGSTVLENCQSQEFLTADCVAVITAEQEAVAADEGTIREAWNAMDGFEACQAEFVAETCPAAVDQFLQGGDLCASESLAAENQSALCEDITNADESATEACETGAAVLEFCAAYVVPS